MFDNAIPSDPITHQLGKLVKTLKVRCDECETLLQMRSRKAEQFAKGEKVDFEEEYNYCPTCEIEFSIKEGKGWKEKYADHEKSVRSRQAYERDYRKSLYKGKRKNS